MYAKQHRYPNCYQPHTMTLFRHTINKPLRSLSYKPSKQLSSKTIPPTYPIEEERNPHCNPNKYYPARIGETIGNKYCIISKLGWGANSTAWLAKDISRSVTHSKYPLVKHTLDPYLSNTTKLALAINQICNREDHELR